MAKPKEPKYVRRARRYLTEAERAELLRQRGIFRGVYTTHRVRPGLFSTIGKFLAIVGVSAFCGLFIVSGTVSDSVVVLGGGIHGHATVDACHRGSKSITCTGTFTSDPGYGNIVIDDIVVEGAGRVGTTVDARVGSADSNHAYAGWSLIPLVPITLFGVALLGLVAMLVAWPLRAAIHLWRPDVWPYWIGPLAAPRNPRWVGIAMKAAGVYGAVLAVAFLLALASGIAGLYGVGFCILVAVVLAIRWVTRRASRRPSPVDSAEAILKREGRGRPDH